MSDLANKVREANGNQSGAPPEGTAPAPWPNPPAVWWGQAPDGRKWLLLDSKLLDGERILLVFEKQHLTEARQAYPGTVIYFPPEVEELKRVKDAPDTIKFLHRIKKEFGAWIVPLNPKPAGR